MRFAYFFFGHMSKEKDDARGSRLVNPLASKSGRLARFEHSLQEELNEIARQKCDNLVQKFVNCSKEQGLLVVIKCREEHSAVNECLHQYTNREEFKKLYDSRVDDWRAKEKERAKTIVAELKASKST